MNQTILAPAYVVLLVTLFAGTLRAQLPLQNSVLDPGEKVETLFTSGVGYLLEGPTMTDDGILFFTDILMRDAGSLVDGIIWKYDIARGDFSVFRSPSGMANGLLIDPQGRLIACEGADGGGRKVVRTDSDGKSEILVDYFQNRPFNSPNDLVMDSNGRIYFTDPRYSGPEAVDQSVQGVYRIDPDGSVHLIIANIPKPNGIIISPDQTTLYVANNEGNGTTGPLPNHYEGPVGSNHGSVYAYTLDGKGNAVFKVILIDLHGDGPDGMKIDTEGNLYIALPGRIGVYNPDGTLIAEIPVPNQAVTNLCFGKGKWSNTLFVTASKTLYKVKLKKQGFHLPNTVK